MWKTLRISEKFGQKFWKFEKLPCFALAEGDFVLKVPLLQSVKAL